MAALDNLEFTEDELRAIDELLPPASKDRQPAGGNVPLNFASKGVASLTSVEAISPGDLRLFVVARPEADADVGSTGFLGMGAAVLHR